MIDKEKYLSEPEFSFKRLIDSFWVYLVAMWSIKFQVIGSALIVTLLLGGLKLVKEPQYTAETTFVIDGDSGAGGGDLSGIASVVGINLGSFGQNSSLFQTENIIELYRSKRMLRDVFYDKYQGKRMITWWGESKKVIKKWQRATNDEAFSFEVPAESLTVTHDSIVFEVIEKFREKHLVADKIDRKLSIISVKVSDTNEEFAQQFNAKLVTHVNDFYTQTRTKKTGDNLFVLQRQADSVRQVLDSSLFLLAQATELIPNANQLYQTNQVPLKKLQIDVQASSLVYQEIVKNLELAKISHRQEMPLIQVIDEPWLPLDNDIDSFLKTLVVSLFLGGFISFTAFSVRYFFQQVIAG
jgi:uncharacterized protein involved in exopolysaccharide biosynthesis